MTPDDPSSSSAQTVTIPRAEYERLLRLEAENIELREQIRMLVERLNEVERAHAELLKRVTGRTSEKKKTSSRNVANPRSKNDAAAQKKRKANRDTQHHNAPSEDVEHPLTDEQRAECPSCGSPDIRAMGADPPSFEWVYVPGRLMRRRHHRHKGCCAHCGEIVRAPAPDRVYDGAKYDAGFMAETVVRKVVDAMPLYR